MFINLAVLIAFFVAIAFFAIVIIFVYRKHHAKIDKTLDQMSQDYKRLQNETNSKFTSVNGQLNKSLDAAKDEIKDHVTKASVAAAEKAVGDIAHQIAEHTKEALGSVVTTIESHVLNKDNQGS